jgi:hypothetical protein
VSAAASGRGTRLALEEEEEGDGIARHAREASAKKERGV